MIWLKYTNVTDEWQFQTVDDVETVLGTQRPGETILLA